MSGVVDYSFSPEALAARALDRLSLAVPDLAPGKQLHGDHHLNPDIQPEMIPGRRLAAVLVPVVARPEEATVLLTRRASHLRQHSGQVAFPGGKVDAEDSSPMAAALREAEEEIGLDRRFVRPLGYLDPYLTTTGFDILPVLSIVEPGFDLTINRDEVELAFEVPLAFLMTPANHVMGSREWKGMERRFYTMPYGDHYIWGVTAGIVRAMYQRLYAA
ncbi:CoA pyrophosphatase [uncultured Alsobacter sp.]|uniref:CoA pyrophosphatase n=1 Tax=uncultured Alsobacter sp. TaxID=1748258 RepID=UPI0025D4D3D7|nr:CoA pyrophosphatase [uncultured Alsobacter sp.]